MNKRSAKSARLPAPIEVILSVTKFNDIFRAGRPTQFVMKLARSHPLATIEGDTIIVRPPGAPIRFTLTTGDKTRERYYPVGITFVRAGAKKASDDLRLGFINFPERDTHAQEKEMIITDSYKDSAYPVRYKFSVVVQRGSDGRIGIIDPDIEHEPPA
jgi:hypothetical protein